MKDNFLPASIQTAINNARTLCHEVGAELTFDDPAFEIAMDMAYILDELFLPRASAKSEPA